MSLKTELLEAKLRHGQSLGKGRHVSEKIHLGLIPVPGTAQRAAKRDRGEVPSLKTSLNDEVQGTLFECMKAGMHASAAAAGLGIAKDTLSQWMAKGKRDVGLGLHTPYSRLYVALSQAQSLAEEKALSNLMDAAEEPKHWAANAWFLERRFPKRWGKTITSKQEITGADGGPIKQQVAVLMVSPEKLSAALALTEGKNHQIIEVSSDREETIDVDSDLDGEATSE